MWSMRYPGPTALDAVSQEEPALLPLCLWSARRRGRCRGWSSVEGRASRMSPSRSRSRLASILDESLSTTSETGGNVLSRAGPVFTPVSCGRPEAFRPRPVLPAVPVSTGDGPTLWSGLGESLILHFHVLLFRENKVLFSWCSYVNCLFPFTLFSAPGWEGYGFSRGLVEVRTFC